MKRHSSSGGLLGGQYVLWIPFCSPAWHLALGPQCLRLRSVRREMCKLGTEVPLSLAQAFCWAVTSLSWAKLLHWPLQQSHAGNFVLSQHFYKVAFLRLPVLFKKKRKKRRKKAILCLFSKWNSHWKYSWFRRVNGLSGLFPYRGSIWICLWRKPAKCYMPKVASWEELL